jgi:bis(5'-nucleosyl)-tetraphosphatase (symmetrical)
MSTYVFGDVHGRADALRALLKCIAFGPSDKVLRIVSELGHQATTVLGNHDLHMLAVLLGAQTMRPKDTFQDVIDAPDRTKLVDWLLTQQLAAQSGDALIVHAGVLPEWDVASTLSIAKDIETSLQNDPVSLFKTMYGNEPTKWRDELDADDRLRIGINALTRARVIGDSGHMEFKFKGMYADIPPGLSPWFEMTSIKTPLFFGHWSALGLKKYDNAFALDSGAAWGRELSCIRLEDSQVFQEKVNE